MVDRPIPFSPPMIRALIEGRKTQTRRILSPSNTRRDGHPWPKNYPWEAHDWANAWVDPGPSPAGNPGPYLKAPYPDEETVHRVYPMYWPGDCLWVREKLERANGEAVGYPADNTWLPNTPWRWQRTFLPSIHMPRELSRLTLLVDEVRVQRLQKISEDDAIEEGVDTERCCRNPSREFGPGDWGNVCCGQPYLTDPRDEFIDLWSSINGPESWDANPWVVALTFRVVRGNIDDVKSDD